MYSISTRGRKFVTKLMSCCLDLAGEYQMTSFNGGWIGETHAQTVPVGGAGLVNMSAAGFSSNRHNPGFLIAENGAGEDHGRVYGFNLVYSGNHYAGVRRSAQGLTRVMQGISPAQLRISLAPGESFETPEAVLAARSLTASMTRTRSGPKAASSVSNRRRECQLW